MNIQLLLFTAALSVFNLVNARPQQVPATPPPGQCVIQEEGRTWIGVCTTTGALDDKVLLGSPSCESSERCLVNRMPCSSESDFFCVTEGTRCHGAIRLQDHPGWTGELLGKNLGICPQDLVCCHGCIGELCNPLVYKFSSNQPLIDLLQIAGLPPTTSPESPSPQGFQPYDTSFDLAESTPPSVPNTGTLSPPSTDTTKFGQPSTEATDLIINQNFQQIPGQNIDPNTGKSTSDFFDQAPTRMNLNQGITMPLGNQLETPDLRPAPVLESPSYEVPLKS